MRSYPNLFFGSFALFYLMFCGSQLTWASQDKGTLNAILIAVNDYCGDLALKIPEAQAPTVELIGANSTGSVTQSDCPQGGDLLKGYERYYLSNSINYMKEALEVLAYKTGKEPGAIYILSEYGIDNKKKKYIGSESLEIKTPDGKEIYRLPTERNIKDALKALSIKLKNEGESDDLFVFYFTGHGKILNKNQKLPTVFTSGASSSITETDEILDLHYLLDLGSKNILGLNVIPGRKLIIVDVCRNDVAPKNNILPWKFDLPNLQRNSQLQDLKDKKITVYLSTENESVSKVNTKENIGYFTQYVSHALEGYADGFFRLHNRAEFGRNYIDGELSLREVEAFVQHHLEETQNLNQSPVIYPQLNFGEEISLYKEEDNPGAIDVVVGNLNSLAELGTSPSMEETSTDFVKRLNEEMGVNGGDYFRAITSVDAIKDRKSLFSVREKLKDVMKNWLSLQEIAPIEETSLIFDQITSIQAEIASIDWKIQPDYLAYLAYSPQTPQGPTLIWIVINLRIDPTKVSLKNSHKLYSLGKSENPNGPDNWSAIEHIWWPLITDDLEALVLPIEKNCKNVHIKTMRLERKSKVRIGCFSFAENLKYSYTNFVDKVWDESSTKEEKNIIRKFHVAKNLPTAFSHASRQQLIPLINPTPKRIPIAFEDLENPSKTRLLCFPVDLRKGGSKHIISDTLGKANLVNYHLGGKIVSINKNSIDFEPNLNNVTWTKGEGESASTMSLSLPNNIGSTISAEALLKAGSQLVESLFNSWPTLRKTAPDCKLKYHTSQIVKDACKQNLAIVPTEF